MFLNKGMIGLFIVKYKVIRPFLFIVLDCEKFIPLVSLYGNRNIFRYILLSFHEFHVSAFLGLFREFKIYDVTVGRTSPIFASSSLSIFFVIISVCVTFER